MAEKEAREGAAVAFKAYIQILEMVSSLRYLGQTFLEVDNDFPEVFVNLRKARKLWFRLSQILGREGADIRTPGR